MISHYPLSNFHTLTFLLPTYRLLTTHYLLLSSHQRCHVQLMWSYIFTYQWEGHGYAHIPYTTLPTKTLHEARITSQTNPDNATLLTINHTDWSQNHPAIPPTSQLSSYLTIPSPSHSNILPPLVFQLIYHKRANFNHIN